MLGAGAGPVVAQSALPRSQDPQARVDEAAREMGTDARLKGLSHKNRADLVEFVAGNMLFVALHELGHAHVADLGLPVLGREEDAADSFATLALLRMGTDFSNQVLVQAARGWFLMDRRATKKKKMLAFYDEHGLDQQRAYNIVCLMVGSDPEKFKGLADWVKMPEERQGTCQGDYSNAVYSWDMVLKPHRRAADQSKTQVDVVYGDGKGKYDVNARSLRAIRFLETIAEYAAEHVVWRAPFTVEMQSCGDPNAEWNISSRKETVCYELVEEYVQLFSDQADERQSSTKASMHDVIVQNLRRLRLNLSMSQDKLADGAGLPRTWLKRMEGGQEDATVEQLEKLARALNVETVAFFAPGVKDITPPKSRSAARRHR